MKLIYTLLFITILIVSHACTKTEEILQKDTNPLRIEIPTDKNITANKKEIILSANVLYIPTEEAVLEHGFAFNRDASFDDPMKIEKFIINEKIKPGEINFKLPDIQFAEFNTQYGYYYFVRTATQTFKSNLKYFELSKFIINYQYDLKATVNEIINVNGDFTDLTKDYTIYDNKGNVIPYSINDKYNISFKMLNKYSHAEDITFYIKNIKDSDEPEYYLAQVEALGTINQPTKNIYKYSDFLRLQGTNLGRDLKIIIGNTEVNYYNELGINDYIYNQFGTLFDLGYDNGRDRVIFSDKLKIQEIPKDIIQFVGTHSHPHTDAYINPVDLAEYSNYYNCSLGGVGCGLYGELNGLNKITIRNVPDGKYPVKLSSNHVNYTSRSLLNIESLKLTSISKSEAKAYERIEVKGNFLTTESYFANVGNLTTEIVITKPGEGYFINPQYLKGTYPVEIGYNENTFKERVTIFTNKTITITGTENISIDFFPKKANAGDRIQLTQTGISSSILFIGSLSTMLSYDEQDKTWYFYIPSYLPKGKYKLSLLNSIGYDLYHYESTDYIEIF